MWSGCEEGVDFGGGLNRLFFEGGNVLVEVPFDTSFLGLLDIVLSLSVVEWFLELGSSLFADWDSIARWRRCEIVLEKIKN